MGFSGKYRAVETAPAALTPPWQVIACAWVVLFALFLVFGRDIGGWAEASERPAVQRYLLPTAMLLSTAAERSGVVTLRETVEDAVHLVYDNPVYVASRGEEAMSAAPTISLALCRPAEASEALQTAGKPKVTRILLVGASSIQEELGAEIERQLKQYKGVDIRREGRYSTGLARPDYFDWTPELKKLIAEYKPDIVMAQWGGKDKMTRAGDGTHFTSYGAEYVAGELVNHLAEHFMLGEG